MQIVVARLAQLEIDESIVYYETECEGLGLRFKGAVQAAIARIQQYPDAWPICCPEIRGCLVRRFPFRVYYSAQPEEIVILAVAHLHRKPGYWLDRL